MYLLILKQGHTLAQADLKLTMLSSYHSLSIARVTAVNHNIQLRGVFW